ncbi:hypothetical protein KL86PLE_40524 [uncultured Pleomorphomonas sp.]|uniref:Uncharacterized protein n=1 Tax=uncultured Pleomorphomonas sp. TaxID=442121 RepID=A0A212LH69_9HYPH|nr:hypothetical protein KL86PLE_40524 [uncultured Pleomorphomonas sp.]
MEQADHLGEGDDRLGRLVDGGPRRARRPAGAEGGDLDRDRHGGRLQEVVRRARRRRRRLSRPPRPQGHGDDAAALGLRGVDGAAQPCQRKRRHHAGDGRLRPQSLPPVRAGRRHPRHAGKDDDPDADDPLTPDAGARPGGRVPALLLPSLSPT